MYLDIQLKDELSIANIHCIGVGSCLYSVITVDTPGINSNSDNNIISNSIARIDIICFGENSCEESVMTIIGVNNFELNCTAPHSCEEMGFTMTSLNVPSGILTVNCDGRESCEDMIVTGITLDTVNINCFSGTRTCHNMQVTLYLLFAV